MNDSPIKTKAAIRRCKTPSGAAESVHGGITGKMMPRRKVSLVSWGWSEWVKPPSFDKTKMKQKKANVLMMFAGLVLFLWTFLAGYKDIQYFPLTEMHIHTVGNQDGRIDGMWFGRSFLGGSYTSHGDCLCGEPTRWQGRTTKNGSGMSCADSEPSVFRE